MCTELYVEWGRAPPPHQFLGVENYGSSLYFALYNLLLDSLDRIPLYINVVKSHFLLSIIFSQFQL